MPEITRLNLTAHYRSVSFKGRKPTFRQNETVQDEFCSADSVREKKTPKETLLGRLKKRLSGNLISFKANEILLEHLFTQQNGGLHNTDTKEIKAFIKELSALNYENISEKYIYLIEEVSRGRRIVPTFIRNILSSENITKKTVKSLHELVNSSRLPFSGRGITYRIEAMVYYLNNYPNFNSMTTKNQYDFIDKMEYYFDAEDISALDDDNDLMRFDLIKDIKKLGSTTALKELLTKKAKNSPVSLIPVDKNLVKNFMNDDSFSFENLQESFKNFNIYRYTRGIPLKYSRANFIRDFKNGLGMLDNEERKQVFEYFEFSIDEDDDIIGIPVPNNSSISKYSPKVQNTILAERKLVEDFMKNNEIRLDKEDKKVQDILNKFVKVFPEFISVIGKIQHRHDSIDFHTLDVLKRCLNDPKTKELSQKEMRILFLSVMFHDIAKKQLVLDRNHQKPSAYYAKEIIKKLPVTPEEKERIYSLILNSHWTTDNNSDFDNALNFRFNNDFKMAQILACADRNSAGFDLPIDLKLIQDIQNHIDKINSTGIPLFADNLPADKSKFPISEDGIMYLDFSDENADLSQYGFKKGTKVKDLSFLCHNTTNLLGEFINLCDDSKDVCLSLEYKNSAKKGILTNYNAGYNKNCHVILHCNNENIGAGGINVSCTGGKKGRTEFKNYAFMNCFEEPENAYENRLYTSRRSEIPNILKEKMNLNDKEYAEFFCKINRFETKSDIKNIVLSTGRILTAEEIKENITFVQNNLLNNKSSEQYINEIIMFRPKIEAIVTEKYDFFKTPEENSEIKQIAKKYNIPVILV